MASRARRSLEVGGDTRAQQQADGRQSRLGRNDRWPSARPAHDWNRLCTSRKRKARYRPGKQSRDLSLPHRNRAGLSLSDWGSWFTGYSGATSVPACAQPGERHPLKELPITLTAVSKHDPARRAAGSSPRRGTGGHGMACFLLADAGSATAPVVDDHCAGGGQGGHGRPEVVAAQQEIHRMRASRSGRDEDPHHRPGGAAAGAITQSGRPGPVSLVIGRRSGSLVAGGLPAALARRRGNLILMKPASDSREPSRRDLALVPDGTFGPKHQGRPPCDRRTECING